MLLALAICEICPSSDVDVIISVLMNLFDTRTSLVSLLKAMIDREISHTGILALMTLDINLMIMYCRERGCPVSGQFNNYSVFVGFREAPWIQLPQKPNHPLSEIHGFCTTWAWF
jgi:hypothetical protein